MRSLPLIFALAALTSCASHFEIHTGLQATTRDHYEFWLVSERSLLREPNAQFRIYTEGPLDDHMQMGELLARHAEAGDLVPVWQLRRSWTERGAPEDFEAGPLYDYVLRVPRSSLAEFPADRPVRGCVVLVSKPYFASDFSREVWLFPRLQ